MYTRGGDALLGNKLGFIIPTIVIYILLSCLAYLWIDDKQDNWKKNIIIITNLVSAIIFGLASIFPAQWFLITVPFTILLFLYVKTYKSTFVLLQFLINIFYFWRVFIQYPLTQETMLNDGILGSNVLNIVDAFSNIFVEKIYNICSLDMISSILFALMICQVLFAFNILKNIQNNILMLIYY